MAVTINKKSIGKLAAAKKRGRGRPREKEDQPKLSPLNMRTTREIREKLESAADKSGRSLTQEVERRLEQSFAREERVQEIQKTVRQDIVEQTFGGQEIFDVMRVLASEIALVEGVTGETLAGPAANREIRHLIDITLKSLITKT